MTTCDYIGLTERTPSRGRLSRRKCGRHGRAIVCIKDERRVYRTRCADHIPEMSDDWTVTAA